MAIEPSYPEGWYHPTTTVVAWIVGICTLYTIAWQLSCRNDDPREPPVVAPTIPIPFIGHLLGMALQGGRYVKKLGLHHRSQPIFTMRILGQRIYVVTSPPLAAAVQRASKALSFTPLIPEVTGPVLGLDDATVAIVRRHLDPGPGDEWGYLAEIQDLVYHALGPGPYLSELTLGAVRELRDEIATCYAASSSSLSPSPGEGGGKGGTAGSTPPAAMTTDLLLWVRHLVTVATARLLYGPENPIAREPSLEDAFWDFDHGLVALLLNLPYPALTARRAYRGRERLAAALGDYLEEGRHEKKPGSSWIVRRRVELALKHGWTLRAAARSELSFLFAGIVNTTTTAFWVLARLYADADLLAAVRGEVEGAVANKREEKGEEEDRAGDGGNSRLKLRIPALRERCPLLAAVLSECLRLGSDNFSTRRVKEDAVLAGRYALRAGAIVQIAGGVIHADGAVWGDDVGAFNPRRFLPSSSSSSSSDGNNNSCSKSQQQRHPAAFRAFGGGKTLCPGRHFAQSEILAFVALVVLAFDVRAPGGGGGGGGGGGLIQVPPKKDTGLPVHILEPARPVEVIISRRASSSSSSSNGDGGGGGGGVRIEDIEFTMD